MKEPEFQSISFYQKSTTIKEQIKVECKTEIPADSVSKILSVFAKTVINAEPSNDAVNFLGKTTFFICYEDVEGALKRCECGNEFNKEVKAEGVKEDSIISVCFETDKTSGDLSGVKLSVSAVITVKAEVRCRKEINALMGGEDLMIKNSDCLVSRSLGVKKGTYPIEEDFELDFAVSQILSHRADAVVTAVQCGVGCIIVDGEVYLSAILLPSGDKSDIIRANKTLPFRIEIENEDAMPSFTASVKISEKSFKTDIAVDEEGGKSVVTANVVLQYEGEAYSPLEYSLAEDLFSLTENVTPAFDTFKCEKPLSVICNPVKITERANLEDVSESAKIVAVGKEKTEVVSIENSDSGVKISGYLSALIYFKNEDGKYFTVKTEVPFNIKPDCMILENSLYDVSLIAENAEAERISIDQVDISANIIVNLKFFEQSEIKYIKSVECLGEKEICDYPISVYIPTEGEELWSLSKRLNVCPEVLASSNKDLQFPLTGKERIVVFRNK